MPAVYPCEPGVQDDHRFLHRPKIRVGVEHPNNPIGGDSVHAVLADKPALQRRLPKLPISHHPHHNGSDPVHYQLLPVDEEYNPTGDKSTHLCTCAIRVVVDCSLCGYFCVGCSL